MSTNTWNSPLFSGLCSNCFNCLYGCCCTPCAIASAKSQFDGSGWCFNCCCFSCAPMMVRNYVRMGYGIEGRIGMSDCCIASYCAPCVAVQMLNEVESRGPKIVSIASIEQSGYLAPHKDYSCWGDPCDFCMTCQCFCAESAGIYSQLTGAPLWFGMKNFVNICQIQHLVRKSYGIGGDDCYDDCVRPTLCLMIPFWDCMYAYEVISSLRAEVSHRGRPMNFLMETEVHAPAQVVMVDNVIKR